MKALLLACAATATLLSFSACTVVEERHRPAVRSSTSTTTEQTSFRQPMGTTTETSTVRY